MTMRIREVIESRFWRHLPTARTASLYGSTPWTREADARDWVVQSRGWTWQLDNGTIGIGRVPVKTRAEAEQIMREWNSRVDWYKS
jgi:hypothetical protein